jgi:hypothetical protein
MLPLSAFTGKPEFYQTLHFLDDVILRCRPLINSVKADESNTLFTWYNRPEISKQLGVELTDHQYHTVLSRLETLRPLARIPEVSSLLSPLSPNLTNVLEERITVETHGPASLLKKKQAIFNEMGKPVGFGSERPRGQLSPWSSVPGKLGKPFRRWLTA